MTITAHPSSRKLGGGSARVSSPCQTQLPAGKRPKLNIRTIGLVSRNYWDKLPRKRDFSGNLDEVLTILDNKRCDTVLFSLWSIIRPFSVKKHLSAMKLKHIKAVFYEEFAMDTAEKKKFPAKPGSSRFVVCHCKDGVWHEYKFNGFFASLMPNNVDKKAASVAGWNIKTWMRAKAECLVTRLPERMLGNSCVLICGESNIVRRRHRSKKWKIHDESHIKEAMPGSLKIVLNPRHDRMGPRMNLKREFLSKAPERWVLCVWNKKKRPGKGRNEKSHAWTAFYNGKRRTEKIEPIENAPNGLEVGVIDCR